jgi:hypothetical protein
MKQEGRVSKTLTSSKMDLRSIHQSRPVRGNTRSQG